KFRRNLRAKRKRIAIEGNTRCGQPCASGSTTITSSRELVRLLAPAEVPINSAREIVDKRLARWWCVVPVLRNTPREAVEHALEHGHRQECCDRPEDTSPRHAGAARGSGADSTRPGSDR